MSTTQAIQQSPITRKPRAGRKISLVNATRGAIVVARVSTDDQAAEDKTSLDYQLDICTKKAGELKLPVIRCFREEGRSGAYLTLRTEMLEAIGMIQSGQATHLVTANLTRLARDSKVSMDIKRAVESVGGTLVFTDWDYQNTATGNAAYGMHNTMAQWEKDVFRERSVSNKLEHAKKKGVQCSRSIDPFGYKVVRHADVTRETYPPDMIGKYVIDPEKAAAAAAMFERYLATGSLNTTAQWMIKNKIPTSRNGVWSPLMVKRILDNTLYYGKPVYNKTRRMTDEDRHEQGYANISYAVERPMDEWVWLDAPACVSKELWDACQERLHSGAKRRGCHENKQMLSGIVRCPGCGRGMTHSQTRGGNKDKATSSYRYYNCPKSELKDFDGNPQCRHKTSHKAPKLEADIIAMLEDMALHPEKVASAIGAFRSVRAAGFDPDALAAARKELDRLELQETGTAEAMVSAQMEGGATGIWAKMLGDIARKKAGVQADIEALELAGGDGNLGGETLAGILSGALADASKVLRSEEITNHEKNGLLSSIIQQITPSDKGGYVVTFAPFPSGERVSTWSEDGNHYLSMDESEDAGDRRLLFRSYIWWMSARKQAGCPRCCAKSPIFTTMKWMRWSRD